MKIAVLCSSPEHPVNVRLRKWIDTHSADHEIQLARLPSDLTGGDFLFLVSCGEMVKEFHRNQFRHCLVLHASDLPSDRGWSPHIWSVLEGKNSVVLSLLAADDPMDSGNIWHQLSIQLTGTETFDEINGLLFDAEMKLMDWAIAKCDIEEPRSQVGTPSYRRRRTPFDGEVMAQQTIEQIFDLLRVSDPDRFPAYFTHRGETYLISFQKAASAKAAA